MDNMLFKKPVNTSFERGKVRVLPKSQPYFNFVPKLLKFYNLAPNWLES